MSHLKSVFWKFTPVLGCILMAYLILSCKSSINQDSYYVISHQYPLLNINKWYVDGPYTLEQDSMLSAKQGMLLQSEDSFQNLTSQFRYKGYYEPRYGHIDLKEVYGIALSDTVRALDSLVTYLTCTIDAEEDMNSFLYVRTEMNSNEFVNGESLYKMPLQELDIYPIHLDKGLNKLTVRTQGARRRYFYEAIICDSASLYKIYSKQHTGDIMYPIVKNDSVHLTDRHWAITDSVIRLLFHDVYGRMVSEISLEKESLDYHISGIEDNHAYICSMIKGTDTVRQPIMTGTLEFAVRKYTYLRDSIKDSHPRSFEIDQLMYRLRKLQSVTGKMRTDRWYEFKLAWVIYQLEHTFAHLNGIYGNDKDEYNIKFITYRSPLDNGLQRYILATPNTILKDKKYPLVVIVRPSSGRHYHLFYSPQIAHQHVVNNMQAIADEYDCFIIMPEARMLFDEDMIPFGIAEMNLAIEDVQDHYNIDSEQIFLHANCSGGYRALRLAENTPDMFAGIALYAPIYRCEMRDGIYADAAPESMLENLRNTPLFIFGDPADTHSPVSVYADLVKDCERLHIPYELVLKRNTGHGYNGYHRFLIGKEACEFFKGKKKLQSSNYKIPKHPMDTTIADFYGRPFIYVYNAADTSIGYKELVDSIRSEYERYLYSPLPLVPDTRVTRKMLREKNIFLIGDKFECNTVRKFVESINRDSRCPKDSIISLTVYDKPNAEKGKVLLYTSGNGARFSHSINYPWKRGFRRKITIRLEEKKQ